MRGGWFVAFAPTEAIHLIVVSLFHFGVHGLCRQFSDKPVSKQRQAMSLKISIRGGPNDTSPEKDR
jgi:hypothetical protein